MKVFVLFVFIPSLIVADILCPNSKTTCPEDKQCCEVNGEHSCCDPGDDQDVPDIREKVFPGDEIMSSAAFQTSFSVNTSKSYYCDLFSCSGTCCEDGCCSFSLATCCGGGRCCPSSSKCCSDGRCCPSLNTCCNDGRCCPFLSTCCDSGCCGPSKRCCGDGCCDSGSTCCGTWCCKAGHRCGSSYKTCRSKGVTISPEIVVLILMAASVFVSRRL